MIRPLYPIFSLASSNPEHEMYFGQIAKIRDGDSEFRNAFVFGDMAVPGSDRDYNDLIVHFSGITHALRPVPCTLHP